MKKTLIEELEVFQEIIVKRDEYLSFLSDFEKKAEESQDYPLQATPRILRDMLDSLLKLKLSTDTRSQQDIFGQAGIAHSLDSKVKLTHALGMISGTDYDLLMAIDRINQEFERTAPIRSFKSELINDLCEKLEVPKDEYIPQWIWEKNQERQLSRQDLNPITPETDGRTRYIYVFYYLYTQIENRFTYHQVSQAGAGIPMESMPLTLVMQRMMASYSMLIRKVQAKKVEMEELEKTYAEELKEMEVQGIGRFDGDDLWDDLWERKTMTSLYLTELMKAKTATDETYVTYFNSFIPTIELLKKEEAS